MPTGLSGSVTSRWGASATPCGILEINNTRMADLLGVKDVPLLPIHAVHTVFSTQNIEQQRLARRFERLALATQQPSSAPVPVRSLQLRQRVRDNGEHDTFRSDNWYTALVQKVSHWAQVAAAHPGRLLLCSDNDVSLLPGWTEELAAAFRSAGGGLDLLFQREGGDDPFFEPFPYNSGFFLMRGSPRLARFWRQVAIRTERERPGMGVCCPDS
jgi:hypothetical protein